MIRDSARRLHGALLAADRVFRLFRSGFLGKVSPVHFFWGSFDLAVTRFSGRPAPPHPGGIPNLPDEVTREAYSHEVSSAGFWPGGAGVEGGPFFYSYAYPAPEGLRARRRSRPRPRASTPALGEFMLDYEAVRTAADPDAALLAFLDSTYEAAADLGQLGPRRARMRARRAGRAAPGLDGEALAAAAGALGVGIVEHEAGGEIVLDASPSSSRPDRGPRRRRCRRRRPASRSSRRTSPPR